MPSALARSVQARLNRLGRNPFEAARKGGLERSFINDILIGRKKSVRGDNIGRLATALDWTVADLMMRIDGESGHRASPASGCRGKDPARACRGGLGRHRQARAGGV